VADAEIIKLSSRRHADELRDTWPSRALRHLRRSPLSIVVLSVLAHSFDEHMPTLLAVTFPGFRSITPPFLCSAAKISHSGAVVADIVDKHQRHVRDMVVFRSTEQMQAVFRKLADELRLDDAERTQMFEAVRAWVVADRRLDPTFDPRDPDARRLVQ
jgi:hypothetical protein